MDVGDVYHIECEDEEGEAIVVEIKQGGKVVMRVQADDTGEFLDIELEMDEVESGIVRSVRRVP